ncbi:unnamed protein product [Pedinophyceae sp. YPF-701]|nr:unnamed protein product [Pedinophyceae sp. YPF-701]
MLALVLSHMNSLYRASKRLLRTTLERHRLSEKEGSARRPATIFSPASKTISMVMPAYNEENRMPSTLAETLNYLAQRRSRQGESFTYEIIVVSDGSTDQTTKVAMDFADRIGYDTVRVLELPRNMGKGAAVKQGVLAARGELILMVDSDGATAIEDVEKLEAEMARVLASGASAGPAGAETAVVERKHGMVVGSRAHLEGAALAKRSWYRNMLMHGFHLLVVLVAGHAIKDTQCGFKLFTRDAAAALFSNMKLQRWCFDVELVHLAQRLHVPVREVAVNWTEIPGSKIRATSMLNMAYEIGLLLLGYTIVGNWRPLKLPQLLGESAPAGKKAQ